MNICLNDKNMGKKEAYKMSRRYAKITVDLKTKQVFLHEDKVVY